MHNSLQKIKVYVPSTPQPWTKCVGFDVRNVLFEKCFDYTSDITKADVILHNGLRDNEAKKWLVENQYILTDKLLIDVDPCFHIQENHDKDWLCDRLKLFSEEPLSVIPEKRRPKFILFHTFYNISNDIHPQIWYTDFLWNRQVIYFVTQPDTIFNTDSGNNTPWWPTSVDNKVDKNIYELPNLDFFCSNEYLQEQIDATSDGSSIKAYLSPNRTNYWWQVHLENAGSLVESKQNEKTNVPVRYYCRGQLSELLQNYPGHLGSRAKNNVLLGQAMPPKMISKALAGTLGNFNWWPMNNAYYNSTAVSIYIETITYGNGVKSITEKTWDSLIKGHFILPFGYCGMINDLKSIYNFKFPNWIDYSYDACENDLERWFKYTESVKTLLTTSAKDLFELKIKDKKILKWNRNRFFKLRYRNVPSTIIKKYLDLNNNTE